MGGGGGAGGSGGAVMIKATGNIIAQKGTHILVSYGSGGTGGPHGPGSSCGGRGVTGDPGLIGTYTPQSGSKVP